MVLNKELLDLLLEESELDYSGTLISLFCLYHNVDYRQYVPQEFIDKLVAKKIISITDTTVKFIKPLYSHEITNDNWEWVVQEICIPFGKINSDRRGDVKAAVIRMKKIFAENPEIRKVDVIEAVKAYLNNLDNPKYLKKSHKFILEGAGANVESVLMEYISKRKVKSESYEHKGLR